MAEPRVGFHASAWGSDHLLAALHGVAACGFEGVEVYADISHVYPDKPEEFRDILSVTGVPMAGIHSGGHLTDEDLHEVEVEQWRRLLEWSARAGAEYAVYYGGIETEDPETDRKQAITLLHEIGEIAVAVGVRFCYEPDRRCPFRTSESIAMLMAETDPKLLSADTARIQQMGLDPTLFLMSQKERVGLVHIRDLRAGVEVTPDGDEYCDPGDGTVDLVGVADMLSLIGYSGWIVAVVDNPVESALTSCHKTAEFFRGTLNFAI